MNSLIDLYKGIVSTSDDRLIVRLIKTPIDSYVEVDYGTGCRVTFYTVPEDMPPEYVSVLVTSPREIHRFYISIDENGVVSYDPFEHDDVKIPSVMTSNLYEFVCIVLERYFEEE